VPVTFGVWSKPPPLTITPSSFTFIQTVGGSAPPYQTAEVDSGGVPVPLTILNATNWLNVVDHYEAPAPTPIQVGAVTPLQLPGEYDGSFTIQSPGNSVYAPVTLLVEPASFAPPVVSQVVNAASGVAGGVSPGEILSIRGYSAGASAVSGLKLDASGRVSSNLNGLQVTFDGQAAPLLYTSANQTNLIVPYEVAGKTSTVMQVIYAAASGTPDFERKVETAAWTLPVVPSAPGIFTLDATGTGQASVVNQDGSINSPANPAPRDSVISIYATGEGQTSPPGVTGSVARSAGISPRLPVTATIGGIGAGVQYAGSAPGEVAGLLQVNAVVPHQTAPGSAVPVTITVGGIAAQTGVTIAVR
jgi:trimeric autotransporter adhesin